MHIDTLCLTGGYKPKNGEPRQLPIIESTTFNYDSCEQMADLFDLKKAGYFYSRVQNPTCDQVAAKICALEGGAAAMLTSSGQAAIFYAIFTLAQKGDHVVSSSSIYGGSYNLLASTLKKMGVEATFVDPDCSDEELAQAFRPNTKLVYGETLANPALTVLDIERFAKAAHDHGVPLVVDNTFPTPINCRPFEWGADIVVHSTTKYMDGHASTVGGAIVDAGRFDWKANAAKYPGLTEPDPTYHGLVFVEAFGNAAAYITKATVELMRDLGATASPFSAYILNVGLESLAVRMERHTKNGLAVAKFLESHPQVEYVNYCDLESSKYYERARKYLPKGGCGVLSFSIKGGREAALRFMKALKLIVIETHVADARTCCLAPALTTHRQMTDEELARIGISPSLVRISCGLEHQDDLIADLAQALDAVKSK
ncbi:O-acetylhomoserine aminocarboxypropyltransferase/cysteine synthase family protein [Sutterella sp.]|uniref:O-acetylhomoserine aminocarboxypropyltransferase/cysteine synthase family protein n=1 Tax=Sutterella sp. TaxID=1981025 RepID=UPI0026E032E1|nr:O-acetylhomoserine aminocarboxypropyltransferase/cysteine synthase family protein [Sutterella sp.]MDO5532957.1 O-acetylhomoserine aminocarboxypropyltransferase/cysteine synthase [Sutterella sp.]